MWNFRTLFAAAAIAAAAGTADAAVLVLDDFESYGPASITNFGGFANLAVTDGTVDFVREPDFGLSTPYGSGLVDLDGSTRDGGALRTANFHFNVGDTFVLDFDASGNQRGGAEDSWRFGFTFLNPTDLVSFDSTLPGEPSSPLGPFSDINSLTRTTSSFSGDAWGRYTFSFTAAEAGFASAFISTTSADNVGVLIDNFRLSTTAVPEPETWAALLLGFAGAGAMLRRRRLLPA